MGTALLPILSGEKSDTRDWIFSYLSDNRILRTKRYLLERNTPYRFGTLYDCGESRDGTGYRDVTDATDAETLKSKRVFHGDPRNQAHSDTHRSRTKTAA